MHSRRAERRHPSARALAALAQARVPLTEGMMLANGHRVVEVDAGGAVRVGDVRHDHLPMLVHVADHWRWVQDDRADERAVPDPGDRGTWLLCLDELGRRVGVDTRGGVQWTRLGDGSGWRLSGGGFHDFQDAVLAGVKDDIDALALALQATADRVVAAPRPGHRAG